MAIAHLLLTHGAGAPVQSEFMQDLITELEKLDISVTAFNFDYMAKQVALGKKRPPTKADKLVDEFIKHIEGYKGDIPLFIGGKSMGGRIATMVCAQHSPDAVSGALVFGYPFHPPGKPDTLRLSHFDDIKVPVGIMQGERDTFGKREEIAEYSLPEHIALHYLVDGDHSFKPRKASGLTQEFNIKQAAQHSLAFIQSVLS